MGRKHKLKEKELLENIKGSYGIISTIAARLHVDWHTVDDTIKLYPEAIRAIADEKEATLDFVEGKAISRINEGDGTMIRFYLATKGRQRGYTYEEEPAHGIEIDDNELKIVIEDGDE